MRRLLRIVGVIVVIGALALRALSVRMSEVYSPRWIGESSALAERAGLLRQRPVVANPRLFYRGDSLLIVDAWVEQISRTRAQWLFFSREIREDRYRLVLRADSGFYPTRFDCDAGIADADSVHFGQSGTVHFFRELSHDGSRDTIQLHVSRRADCRPAAR